METKNDLWFLGVGGGDVGKRRTFFRAVKILSMIPKW